MALRGRKVFGAFEKRAPGLPMGATKNKANTRFSTISNILLFLNCGIPITKLTKAKSNIKYSKIKGK